VAQLYLGLPSSPSVPEPPRELKGFRRLELGPGQSATVKFALNARSLSYWDTPSRQWKVMPGDYTVSAGSSSRDLPLSGKFTIE
jgi:beta-glucosidase